MGRKKQEETDTIKRLLGTPVYDEVLMDNLILEIAKNIRKIIEEKKVSRKSLAFLTGMNPAHLCNILNGRDRIGLSSLIKLAIALNCDINEIIPIRKSQKQTLGDRFDTITQNLSTPEKNCALKMIHDYARTQESMRGIAEKGAMIK